MFNPDPKSSLNRIIFAILGVMVIGFGIASLQHTGLIYHNWWKGLVFGPFAIVIGALFIIALFKLGSSRPKKFALAITLDVRSVDLLL
jgi:hypothetical protein